MIQLSEEGQRLLRIGIFIAIAVGLVVVFIFVSLNNGDDKDTSSAQQTNSFSSQNDQGTLDLPPVEESIIVEEDNSVVVEENPEFIQDFEDLLADRDIAAIEAEIAAYKKFIEQYIADVNTWNYDTDFASWSDNIVEKYVSPNEANPASITRISQPEINFCQEIECYSMGFGEFFNEEIPSPGSEFSGYFKVSILFTDKNGNEETTDTFWLVEANIDENNNLRIVYVEDLQVSTIDAD